MRKFTFIWSVQNYSYCWHGECEDLESPTFFAEMMQQTSWNLHLYPRGNGDPDFISLFLKRCDNCNGPEKIALNFELSILDANGRDLESDKIELNDLEFQKSASYGLSDFFERPENNLVGRAFTSDILRVRCTMWIGEGEIDKEALSYAKTRIRIEKISFINTIESFATIILNLKKTFNVTHVSKHALNLSGNVYIRSEPGSEDEVMVEIFLDSQNAHLITCQIYILNSSGKEIECGKIDTRNDLCRKSTMSTPINFEMRNLLDQKHEYLPNDKLTLRCECTLSNGIEFQRIEDTFYDLHLTPLLKQRIRDTKFAPCTSEPKSVSDDLRCLYKDQILSDIRLETKSKIFHAHKSVLCARSPVFTSMLTTNIKDKLMDCIEVEDLEDSTIDQFLLFLYTDILEGLQWESAMKLYYSAYKYQVQRLKDFCTSFLITGLNKRNIGDLLILADKHQDSDLKTAVEKFICMRDKQIFCTDEWECFMETHSEIALKTMYFYLKNGRD
ncbi:TD and POZ domain-containing protein 5 [Araneus ventricosus]|uniref:TD and POZ domain-containing protein 5 n=1 Tax=Araneus ventricosus TaxID=182803 RepID=A0A4Y2C595_ARAVE|nr:TD and POZ domain-containing protein 5 [Araneus ventricosus]